MALTFGAATSDRVELAAGNDNQNAFTVIGWFYKTADTAGRRLWDKGSGNSKTLFLQFQAADDFGLYVTRAGADADSSSLTGAFPANQWMCIAGTYDGADGPRLFAGSLTATVAETAYNFRIVGDGAEADDSGVAHIIGNSNALTQAFPGRIATFAHFRRRLTVQELIRWQFQPYTDADCDIFMELGYAGTGTQPNLVSLGNGLNGTVTGATVADHVPLAPPAARFTGFGDIWLPPIRRPRRFHRSDAVHRASRW